MVIEESILIVSPIQKVWNIFTDLTCWSGWNTVLENMSANSLRLSEGSRYRFCIRPFVVPVYFEPTIEEVVPAKKIAWRGEKFGISALHEYIFQETDEGVSVTSRETFSGPAVVLSGVLFSRGRLKDMTKTLLKNLKEAAENKEYNGPKD